MNKALAASLLLLATTSAFAVGSTAPLSQDERSIAEILLNNRVRIDQTLEQAGVHGAVSLTGGRSFEGSTPMFASSGYGIEVSQCDEATHCAALGNLLITKSSKYTGGKWTSSIDINFEKLGQQ